MSQDILQQVTLAIQDNHLKVNIQPDESTGAHSCSQLLVSAKYIMKKTKQNHSIRQVPRGTGIESTRNWCDTVLKITLFTHNIWKIFRICLYKDDNTPYHNDTPFHHLLHHHALVRKTLCYNAEGKFVYYGQHSKFQQKSLPLPCPLQRNWHQAHYPVSPYGNEVAEWLLMFLDCRKKSASL